MLLSVLLCIAMVFTACDKAPKDDADDTTKQTENTEDTSTDTDNDTDGEDYAEIKDVEAKVENFFKFEAIDSKVLGEASKYEGEVVSRLDNYFVLKESTVNEKNRVTETFTVYNTTAEEPILTVKNRFDNGNYDSFNWFDTIINQEYLMQHFGSEYTDKSEIKYPTDVMDVRVCELGTTYIIEVATAEVKPLEPDFEENPYACYYDIKITYAYYDLAGTRIAQSNEKEYFDGYYGETTSSIRVSIGGTIAYVDSNTGLLLKTVNPDTNVIYEGYDEETGKYGFYFGSVAAPDYNRTEYVEVYEKQTGERVLRYYFDQADWANYCVLRNGDVLIQYINKLDDDSTKAYDFTYAIYNDGELDRFTLDTYVLNVASGEATAIDCDYVVARLTPNNTYNASFFESIKKNSGLVCTDNVVNFAVIVTINEHKELEVKIDEFSWNYQGMKLAVLNNDASVMFQLDSMIADQKTVQIDEYDLENLDLGFQQLASGDFLVETYDEKLAIVGADGNVRFYIDIEEDSKFYMTGRCIVTDKNVYDFDGKLIYSFDEHNYTLVQAFGNKVIVSRQVDATPDFMDDNEFENEYYILDATNNFMETLAFDKSAELELREMGDDYVIFYNYGTHRYTMYNVNLEHVLTTCGEMYVMRVANGYVVETYNDSYGTLYYTVQ